MLNSEGPSQSCFMKCRPVARAGHSSSKTSWFWIKIHTETVD